MKISVTFQEIIRKGKLLSKILEDYIIRDIFWSYPLQNFLNLIKQKFKEILFKL